MNLQVFYRQFFLAVSPGSLIFERDYLSASPASSRLQCPTFAAVVLCRFPVPRQNRNLHLSATCTAFDQPFFWVGCLQSKGDYRRRYLRLF